MHQRRGGSHNDQRFVRGALDAQKESCRCVPVECKLEFAFVAGHVASKAKVHQLAVGMLSMRHKCGHIIKDDREIDATLLQGNGDDVVPEDVQMWTQCIIPFREATPFSSTNF